MMESTMRHILYLALGLAIGTCGAMGYVSHHITGRLAGLIGDTDPKLVGGAAHECYRECVEGDTRICNYEFNMVEYATMASACGDCPYTEADCYNAGCITAGGETREIKVANHMLPGPSVQVCVGDIIRVALVNDFGSDTATIHWHGMTQRDTPYMDGVPYVTQCPVQPGNTFVYNFTADPIGTHLWHSHSALQEPDGFHGSVVVRGVNDTLAQYYDYDLADHLIMIWHWFGEITSSVVKSTFFSSTVAEGHSLTINGMAATEYFELDGVNYTTPLANFTVEQGYRYRFRVIGNMAIYCPVQVSVDDHTLLVIATDGSSVKPVEAESFIIGAGERYDFVLTADQSIGDYWIKFRGLGNCAFGSTYGTAILHYKNGSYADPLGSVTYDDTERSGVLINPVGLTSSYPNNTLIDVADLENTSEDAVDVSGDPDYIFYPILKLNSYDAFQTPGPYAQVNNVSFGFPPVPFLTQYKDVTEDMICLQGNSSNADCVGDYCECPTMYAVDLGSLVEICFADNSTIGDDNHPMHMHGGYFRVVYMETGDGNLTLDDLKARNENGSLEKNFDTAPQKDVLGIPAHGVACVRLVADNPGYWFVHCHVTVHTEEGMGFVFKVGSDDEMVHPPSDFPTCGNYNITDTSNQAPNRPNRPKPPNRPEPPNRPNRPNRPNKPHRPGQTSGDTCAMNS